VGGDFCWCTQPRWRTILPPILNNVKKRTINIGEEQLQKAVTGAGLSPEIASRLWTELSTASESEPRFEAAHVGYYFGALLVIGAMGWFMTSGWDSFQGWQLFAIAAAYAAIFVVVAARLGPQPMFRIPAGLLATMAVCMVPLAVYGLERQFHLWPSTDPGSYTRFHPYINASWVLMEVATVVAAIVALRFFPFPFLTAPAAYALWYMSMDLTALVFKRNWTWQELCKISVAFGLAMMIVSYLLDRRTRLDFSFWGYLFGLLTFTGGLSLLDSGNQLAKFGYCLIHLAMIVVALIIERKVFLIFGGLGVFCYLGNEAYGYFRDSVAFPFVLSFLGIALIVAAMQFKKHEAALQQWAAAQLGVRTRAERLP
jgi:hypothetical protein